MSKFSHPSRARRCSTTYLSADILFLHLNAYSAFEKVLPSKIFRIRCNGETDLGGCGWLCGEVHRDEVPNAAVFGPCNAAEAVQKLDGLILQDQPREAFVARYARRAISVAMAADILLLARVNS